MEPVGSPDNTQVVTRMYLFEQRINSRRKITIINTVDYTAYVVQVGPNANHDSVANII